MLSGSCIEIRVQENNRCNALLQVVIMYVCVRTIYFQTEKNWRFLGAKTFLLSH